MSNKQNKTRRTFDRGQWPSKSVRAHYKLMPLDFILQGVNDWRLPTRLRFEMAKAALPYIHHGLTSIAIGGADRKPQHALD
jgi:hypothetical protein